MNEEDEDEALMQHIEQSSKEELFEELKNYRNCLHDAKEVCNNARIRLPQALENLEKAIEEHWHPSKAETPMNVAHEAIKMTLADMMTTVEPLPVSEKQVVGYLKDYAAENDIEHVSIQFTATDKKFPDSRDNLFFYCNNRGHSGQSSRSIREAKSRLVDEMDRLGAKV